MGGILTYEYGFLNFTKGFAVLSGFAVITAVFRKFIWDIQEISLDLPDRFTDSNFAYYAICTYLVPIIVISPIKIFFPMIPVSPLLNVFVAVALGLIIMAELILFNRFVMYFCEPRRS